jgi:predicted metal-binding protein
MSPDIPQLSKKVRNAIRELGIQVCVDIPASHLKPEHRIRELCHENKCGNYGAHYMCPPHIGTIDEIAQRIRRFTFGFILQYTKPLDVRNDPEGVTRSKVEFHRRILKLEKDLEKGGISDVWGLMGGDCALCRPCKAVSAEPCPYPDQARTSLEALGVDVLALLDTLGLDSRFHSHRITWTGCILYREGAGKSVKK